MALLVFSVIDLGVMIYGYNHRRSTPWSARPRSSLIIYFLITLAYAVRAAPPTASSAFSLGQSAWPVIIFVLAYTVLIMIVLSLRRRSTAPTVLGYGLALAALWYFGGLLAAQEGHRRRQARRGPISGPAPGRVTATQEPPD